MTQLQTTSVSSVSTGRPHLFRFFRDRSDIIGSIVVIDFRFCIRVRFDSLLSATSLEELLLYILK